MLCIDPRSSTKPKALNRVISGARSEAVRQYLEAKLCISSSFPSTRCSRQSACGRKSRRACGPDAGQPDGGFFTLYLDSSQRWLPALLLRAFRFCSCNTSSAMAPGRKQILSTTERIRLSLQQLGTVSGYAYVTKVQMIHFRNGVAGRQLLNKPDRIQA